MAGLRGPYLPLWQRILLYERVIVLHRHELTHSQIQRTIYSLEGVKIPYSTISSWVRGLNNPLGNVNKFDANPSPQLAYTMGVKASDGSVVNEGKCYRFGLPTIDLEFATETGRSLAKLLGRSKPYQPWWDRSNGRWYVACRSVLLCQLLGQPFETWKPYVEHCRDCVAAFLRAFFDGEGCVARRALTVYNTNKELLYYVQQLLKQHFGLEATGPHNSVRAGYRFRDPTTGKTYETKKDCYYLRVLARDLPLFHRYIGFTIERKQRRLVEALLKRPSPSHLS